MEHFSNTDGRVNKPKQNTDVLVSFRIPCSSVVEKIRIKSRTNFAKSLEGTKKKKQYDRVK